MEKEEVNVEGMLSFKTGWEGICYGLISQGFLCFRFFSVGRKAKGVISGGASYRNELIVLERNVESIYMLFAAGRSV